MFDVFLSLAISFLITFVSIPVIITIAEEKKLFDIPDERKIHTKTIASLGGFGIFAGFVLSSLLAITFTNSVKAQYFMAAAFIIFLLGLKDDILIISPVKKFIGQIIATMIILLKGDVLLHNMNGFLGVYELSEILSWVFTFFTVIVIINSFNLIDGVDGLAASLGLMVSITFGLYFLKTSVLDHAILAFSLAGSLAAFLYFNFQPAKIFMGDTGSLTIGFICSILVIKFINIAPGNTVFPVAAAPAVGFSILMIPLLDTLRVFSVRILRAKSPFSADQNHIHHKLLDIGFSHKKITSVLLIVNILIVALIFAGKGLGNTWLILFMVTAYFGFIGILSQLRIKSKVSVSDKDASIQANVVRFKRIWKGEIPKKNLVE